MSARPGKNPTCLLWPKGQVANGDGRSPYLILELDADPYDPMEKDPARSHALESSLWELQVSCLPVQIQEGI